jgi:hypothetical protein
MEIPENIYSWLRSTNLFTLPSSKPELPEDLLSSFESGVGFTKLLKRLNGIKVTDTQNKQDRLMTPMAEINTLKKASTPAARLYNWNILSQALSLFHISLDQDTKSLIIAGDREMLTEVLTQIFEAEQGKSLQSHQSRQVKDSGLQLDSLDEQKSLQSSESCLEFLILSFVRNFSLRPKQGIGLLAQGCKYLAHIVAKGLKGDFDPVRVWLSEVYSEAEKLSELVVSELKEDSLQFVMNALKPGFLSKDPEVLGWTFRVISRLVLDLNMASVDVWKWFDEDSVLELCLVAIRRNGEEVLGHAIDLFAQVGQGHLFDLLVLRLQAQSKDRLEYLSLISSFFPYFIDSLADEVFETGCVSSWLDLSLQEAENHSVSKQRTLGFNLIRDIVERFYARISESEINASLAVVNRNCRDGNRLIEVMSIAVLFQWLEFFAEQRSSYAGVVYRTLTFLMVEVFAVVDLREIILTNFSEIFRRNQQVPVSVIVEPYVKRVQVIEEPLQVFDYDFIVVLAQYPLLSVKQGILLLDLMGKMYLNDSFFAKAAGVPFTYISSRFIESETMQDYLFVFSRHGLKLAMSVEHKVLNISRLKRKELNESLQQRNRVFDMVSWIAQQWQEDLNSKLKEIILPLNFAYYLASKQNCRGLVSILALLGNVQDMMDQFKEDNPELFEDSKEVEKEKNEKIELEKILDKNDQKVLALVPVSVTSSKSILPKKKSFFPWERAAGDIEKAKKKKQEKDQKIREEEEKKRKALDFQKKKVKQQLEIRKLEQAVGSQSSANLVYEEGLASKLLSYPEDFQLKEIQEEDLQEGIRMILTKYSRVFKVLFQKYSGTGFARKAQNKSEFESHAERKERITDSEYIKILNDHNIIPQLCTKEELKTIMRTYNHKIAKQAEQNYVDYEGFKGVFCQLAYFAYSKKNRDYSHLPPVVSIKLFIDFMREQVRAKGMSTELFDEPDPGTGDKDVVRSLNKLLAKDPNTQLPEGYKKITDKDLKVTFKVPKELKIPKAFKISVEILDTVLEKIGIHILEPQVEFFNVFRAKGVLKEKIPREEKEKQEKNTLNDKKSKEKIKATLISTNVVKLSPTLKFCLAHASPNDKETMEECASLLEDVLHSVQLKLTRVINRAPKAGAQDMKFEQKREMEKKEEDQKKAEEDRKRRLRQQQLQEELNRAKEERAEKLRKDEERRKAEIALEESRKKEKELKHRRDKEEKAKMISEWAKKKDEESKKLKEEENRKKNESEDLKKLEEAKKRNLERYQASLMEKKKKALEMKEEEIKKALAEKEIFEKRKLAGIERMKENKAKDVKSEGKSNDWQFLNNIQVKNYLNSLNPNFDCIFTFYLNLLGKEMPEDASLLWTMFDKFCSQFNIYSMVPQDKTLLIFKSFTKKRTNETLPFEDFKNSLGIFAFRSKDNFSSSEPAEFLKEFLVKFEIILPLNTLKVKLKKMNPEPKKVKSSGLLKNVLKSQKSPNDAKMSENEEKIEESKNQELDLMTGILKEKTEILDKDGSDERRSNSRESSGKKSRSSSDEPKKASRESSRKSSRNEKKDD